MAAGIDGNRRNVKRKRNVGSDEVGKSDGWGKKKGGKYDSVRKGRNQSRFTSAGPGGCLEKRGLRDLIL